MRRPLLSQLEQLVLKKSSRFYMPGHKGHFPGCSRLSGAAPWDVTEIPGMDSLYESGGVIKELEEEAARLYQSKGSFISCGGSTLAIQSMLGLALSEGEEVLMSRGVHRAAVNAAALLGLKVRWVWPMRDAGPLFPGRVCAWQVEEALLENPLVRAVYITSPDYFGLISDLPGVAQICARKGIPLLVDNAHGAHLPFVGGHHPIAAGAALCADSVHKSLPALTGTALLHVGDARYLPRAKGAMALFGSTSPSYLMMASLDYALDFLKQGGALSYLRLAEWVVELRGRLLSYGYELPTGVTDPIRLTLSARKLGYTGLDWQQWLIERGVIPEMCAGDAVVFLLTPLNTQKDLMLLEKLFFSLPFRRPLAGVEALPLPIPLRQMELREALFSPKEELPVERAVGCIAAESKAPCPPGIPLVVAGEEITLELAMLLKRSGISSLNVVL